MNVTKLKLQNSIIKIDFTWIDMIAEPPPELLHQSSGPNMTDKSLDESGIGHLISGSNWNIFQKLRMPFLSKNP